MTISSSLSTVITQYKRGEYASAQATLDQTDDSRLKADANNPALKKELKALNIKPEPRFLCGSGAYDGISVKLALSDLIRDKLVTPVPAQDALRAQQAHITQWQPTAPVLSPVELAALPTYEALFPGGQLPDGLSQDRLDDLRGRGLPESVIQKLKDPAYQFPNAQAQLSCLIGCIEVGRTERESVTGKDVIMIVGNTGAGKSATVNVIQGHKMTKVQGGTLLGAAVVVDPRQPQHGGKVAEVGHGKQSMTFIPDVVEGRHTICDCPGLLDNRGAEISIANAVNIQKIVGSATSIRIMLVVDYNDMSGRRGQGVVATAAILRALLGSESVVKTHAASIMIGVTKVPSGEGLTLERIQAALCEQDDMFKLVKDRIAIVDAIGTGESSWSNAEKLNAALDGLKKLENPKSVLQIVLTESDRQALNEMMQGLSTQFQASVTAEDYVAMREAIILMQGLSQLNIPGVTATVERLLNWCKMMQANRVHEANALSLSNAADAVDRVAALQRGRDELARIPEYADFVARVEAMVALHAKVQADETAFEAVNTRVAGFQDTMATVARETKAAAVATIAAQLAAIGAEEALLIDNQTTLAAEKDRMAGQSAAVYAAGMAELAKQVGDGTDPVSVARREQGKSQLDQQRTTMEAENEAWYTGMMETTTATLGQLTWLKAVRENQLGMIQATEWAVPDVYPNFTTVQAGDVHLGVLPVNRGVVLHESKSVDQVRALLKDWGASDDYIAQNFIGGDDWQTIFTGRGFSFSRLCGKKVEPKLELEKGRQVPQELINFLQQDSVFNAGKKVWEDHMVCWIPAGISLNRFEDELFGKIGAGYHKDHAKFRYFGDKSDKKADVIMSRRTEGGGWCTMYVGDVRKDNGVIPNSRDKLWDAQEKVFNDTCGGQGYEIGKVRDIGVAVLMRYIKTGDTILSRNITGRPWTYARSPEKWATGGISGRHGGVGALDADGLSINDDALDNVSFGVAAARWFSGPLTL